MKFRAVISDTMALHNFIHITTGISKLSKSCVFRVTATHAYFIVSEEEKGTTQPYIWCEMPATTYFSEFTFAGASDEHNEIYFEFDLIDFTNCLALLKQNGKSLKIKLANKDAPCISLTIEQGSVETDVNRECVNDIPIEVISRKHWGDYQEPQFKDFHVSIQFPDLKSIKKIVDRMKNVTNDLTVMANKTGRLSLQAKNTMVTMSVHFSSLCLQSFDVGTAIALLDESQEEHVSTTIDVRKFLNFLAGMHVTNCQATCSIVQSQMVKLHIYQQGIMSLQCFLMEHSS